MTTKAYRAVIFDLDGTLLDNLASFHAAFSKYCQMHPDVLHAGNAQQCEEMTALYRSPDRSGDYRIFCEKWQWQNAPEFDIFWQEWLMLYVHSPVLFPWSLDTLQNLRQKGLRLGMITNGPGHYQHPKIDHSGIIPYFDDILVAGDVGISKPSPEIYRLSAERLQVAVQDCLFVGDTPETDIAGANNAGMDSLLLIGKKDTVGATYTADRVSFLKTLCYPHFQIS